MFHFISENLPKSNKRFMLENYGRKLILHYLNYKPASQLEKIITKYYEPEDPICYDINNIMTIDDFIMKIDIMKRCGIEWEFTDQLAIAILKNTELLNQLKINNIIIDDKRITKYVNNGVRPANLYKYFKSVCFNTANYELAANLAPMVKDLSFNEFVLLNSCYDYKMKEIFASTFTNKIDLEEALCSGLIYDVTTYEKYVSVITKKRQFRFILVYAGKDLLEYLYTDNEIRFKYNKYLENDSWICFQKEDTLIKIADLGLFLGPMSFINIIRHKSYNIHNLLKLKTKSGNNYIETLLYSAFWWDDPDCLLELIYFAGIKEQNIMNYLKIQHNSCLKMLAYIFPAMLSFDKYYHKLFDHVEHIKIAYKMKIWNDYVVDTFQDS